MLRQPLQCILDLGGRMYAHLGLQLQPARDEQLESSPTRLQNDA